MELGKHGFMKPEHIKTNEKESPPRSKCEVGDTVPFKDNKYIAKSIGYSCIGCAFDTDEYCRKHDMPAELPDCCSPEFIIFVKV